MRSLTETFLDALRLAPAQVATVAAVAERRGRQTLFFQQIPEILEALRQTALVESVESSNRLEGVTAPHNRIEAVVREPTLARNRTEQEIAGYRDALALLHDVGEASYLSRNVIRELHRLIYRYLPTAGGHWKETDNEIVERDSRGRITRLRFRPTSAAETPAAMDQLVELFRVASKAGREPLLLVPLTVLDFLCIHPFDDGNGRVARLLTLSLLYQFDYQVGRYISLERMFEESKETYYETLERSSVGWHEARHDPHPWMNYFWGVLLRAYDEFEQRVGEIRTSARGSKTEQIRAAVERQTGPFSISDIQSQCPTTSRDMIRIVLRQLRDEGLIVAQGVGRGAKWEKREQGDGGT